MRVDNFMRSSVVFIGVAFDERFVACGTAMLGCVSRRGVTFSFLVTAKHVIEQLDPGSIAVRVNRKSGGCDILKIQKTVIGHKDIGIDLAIIPISWNQDIYDIGAIELCRGAQEEHFKKNDLDIGVGDEVATIGLYTSHHGLMKNIPVVRIGNIAALPDEPVHTSNGAISGYLIETRSIAGLSGSPVFLNTSRIRVKDDQLEILKGKNVYLPPIGILLGYHLVESSEDQILVPQFQSPQNNTPEASDEHLSRDARNTGFAVVAPIENVFDMIEDPMIQRLIDQSVDHHFAQSGPNPAR